MAQNMRQPRAGHENLAPYDVKDVNADIVLASNENPRNLPTELVARLSAHMSEFQFNRYPDPTAPRLRRQIADANGVDPENVLVGNGGDELLFNMFLAWGGPGRKFLDMPPTFSMYGIDSQITDTEIVSIPRDANFEIDQKAVLKRVAKGDIDLVIISNPNNPTGSLADESFLIELLNKSDALVCVDEAYFEFSRHTMRPHLERHPNLIILRTFSKAFSLAALRVGYVLGGSDVIRELMKVRQPYSVNAFSQWAAQVVYRERMIFETTIQDIIRGRDLLMEGLSNIEGVEVFPSEANYVMLRVDNASSIWRDLLYSHSIYIRDLSRGEGLENCLRVTVGTDEENRSFLKAIDTVVAHYRTMNQFGMEE